MIKFQFNRVIILIVLLGITTIVGTLAGCKKEKTEPDPVTKPEEPDGSQTSVEYIYGDFDPSEENIVNMLAIFKSEMDNSDVSERPLDEALWTIEAYLSYTHSNPHKKYSDYTTYSYNIYLDEVDEINGIPIVDGDDIMAGYESIAGEIADLSPKTAFIIDLSYDSETEEGQHVISVSVIAGEITAYDRDEGEPEASYVGDDMKSYQSSTGCLNFPNYFDKVMNGSFAWSGTCSGGNLYVMVTLNHIDLDPWDSYPGGGSYGSNYKLYQHPAYSSHYGNDCLNDYKGSYAWDDIGSDETISGYLNEAISVHSLIQSGLSSGQYITGFDWEGVEVDTQTGSPRFQYHMKGKLFKAKWVCIPVVLPEPM